MRRRSNGHLLQQAAARWLLVTALAAVLVLVAALRGGRLVFGTVLLLGACAAIAATVVVTRQIGARWLRERDAAARIDRARELRGRLASVVELEGRAGGGFFALLAEQNVDALPRWRPEDVVPRLVSPRTLAAACAAVTALVLVIVFAPWLRPPPPRVVVGDRPMDFVASNESRAGADRLLVAPGTEHQPPAGASGSGGTRSESEDEDSTLATFQEWLQDTLGADEHWQTDDGEVPPSGSRQDTARSARQDRDPKARPVADARGANGGREVPGADGPADATTRQWRRRYTRPRWSGTRGRERHRSDPLRRSARRRHRTRRSLRAGDRRAGPDAAGQRRGALDRHAGGRPEPASRAGGRPAHGAGRAPHDRPTHLRTHRPPAVRARGAGDREPPRERRDRRCRR